MLYCQIRAFQVTSVPLYDLPCHAVDDRVPTSEEGASLRRPTVSTKAGIAVKAANSGDIDGASQSFTLQISGGRSLPSALLWFGGSHVESIVPVRMRPSSAPTGGVPDATSRI